MSVKFITTSIAGVFIVEPDVFRDGRGFFIETFQQEKYAEGGIDKAFVQDNRSHSTKGALRGLHYQLQHPQGKLVHVVTGEIFDVAVDIRRGSSTFGQWVGVYLSAENNRQIYVPEGFAHGFCVLSNTADVVYKCTDFYTPGDEYGILWSDPTIGIDWPITAPILSDKDSRNLELNKVSEKFLPVNLT